MNTTVMKDAFSKLSKVQFEFLHNEFGITEDGIKSKSEEELDELYDKLCEIEVDETLLDESKMNERCEIVSSIVTVVGNYFAKKLGYMDEGEFEKFLTEKE